jgi:hypothetical protein
VDGHDGLGRIDVRCSVQVRGGECGIVRLISATEELAGFDDAAVIDASWCVADALLHPRDAARYETARLAFARVPVAARWIVELQAETELAANGVALRYPSGIRSVVS